MLLGTSQRSNNMTTESTSADKQITVAVPEDRVAEFYAFYGRFLAGFPGRRHRRRTHHGCRPRHEATGPDEREQPAGTETREV